MRINLGTWNMAHWSHKKYSYESWNYFINELGCDILLFQESVPNFEILDKDKLVWNEIGDSRSWGSGVYSKNYKIREFNFNNSFFGAVTAAEVTVSDDLSLIVISLYGLFERIGNVIYATPNMHRILSDLTGILQSRGTKNRVIIGGDYNVSVQIDLDPDYPDNDNKLVFDRLENFGLKNCYDGFFSNFVQTHRHSKSDKPWQNDYFFISRQLHKHLVNCKVIDNEKVRLFSDHNPVIIELEI